MKKYVLLGSILFLAASCNPFVKGGALGVMKTIDGGGTWQGSNKIEGSEDKSISGLAVTELEFDPSNNQKIYLSSGEGLFLSENSGSTWKQILSKISILDFSVDPTNSRVIYTSGIFDDHGKIIRSGDGGASWEVTYNEASLNNAVNSITVNPANTQEIYAGLNSGTVIKSIDGGKSWFSLNDFQDQIIKIRYSTLNNGIYALLRTKGIAKSSDGGVNWSILTDVLKNTSIVNQLSFQQSAVDRFIRMSLDAQTAGVLYVTTSKGLYKSNNDGRNWSFLNIPYKRNSNQLPRAIASTRGGMLAYTSVGNTIFKTLDGGQSWQTQELPTGNQANKIIIDQINQQTAYVGLTTQ